MECRDRLSGDQGDRDSGAIPKIPKREDGKREKEQRA
jgi:hypothetical protein